MNNKTTTQPYFAQQLIAGLLQEDNAIEFFGVKDGQKVFFLQNGKSYPFKKLKPRLFALLQNAYYEDVEAVKSIKQITNNHIRQVELYTYFCYGSLDCTPDINGDVLSPSENFRHQQNCVSLNFISKNITINGHTLLPRELTIIDMIANDALDTAIAEALGITVSTLGFHKRELFKKADCQTKVSLLKKAMDENVL